MTIPIYEWVGQSGTSYKYWIYPIDFYMNEVRLNLTNTPGNYIFTKQGVVDALFLTWTPVYIGETGDLAGRFDSHHKANCIHEHQATHIHVHVSSSIKQYRVDEENDLKDKWNPVCNGLSFLSMGLSQGHR